MTELSEYPRCGRVFGSGDVCNGQMIPFANIDGRVLRQCSNQYCLRTSGEEVHAIPLPDQGLAIVQGGDHAASM